MKINPCIPYVLVILLLIAVLPLQHVADSEKIPETPELAVTIDDLPFSTAGHVAARPTKEGLRLLKKNTRRLLNHLKKERVPAIGFVNAGKLFSGGTAPKKNKEISHLLTMWLDAGMQLGNHTYAHKDMNRVPWPEFREDVIKGETLVKQLVEKRGGTYLYFRHPFLHSGKSPAEKATLAQFLKQWGYIEAPVSIDNSEWIYARAYLNARLQNKPRLAQQVVDEYIPYMEKKFAYYEQQSKALFGRPIKHILLLHANRLNADHLDKLLKMIKKRGYRFISIRDALNDPAYQSKDTYSGRGGISWIHRWAVSMGKKGGFFKGEPQATEFVKKLSGIRYE